MYSLRLRGDICHLLVKAIELLTYSTRRLSNILCSNIFVTLLYMRILLDVMSHV